MSKRFSFKNVRGLPEGMAKEIRRRRSGDAAGAAAAAAPVYIVGDDIELQHFPSGNFCLQLSSHKRRISNFIPGIAIMACGGGQELSMTFNQGPFQLFLN